jgi:hypothetical protein
MKKKIVAVAMGIAMVSTSANAAVLVATFRNQGQCETTWNELNNALRKELRQSGQGVSQNELGAMTHYYCAKVGDGWGLFMA